MLQNTIIKGLAAAALGLGILANYRDYGFIVAAAYTAILLTVLAVFVWQVRCVVRGNCIATSWTTVALATGTFGSLVYYYWNNLIPGQHSLAQLEDQPIASANPVIATITRTARDRFNVDLYKYIDRPGRSL
jgi:hypothetical protein